MSSKNPHLNTIYNKDYFFSGKAWDDGYADYNSYSSPKKHPWFFMVEKILEHKKGGKALDIGCALGHFLSFLPDSFEKYGTDVSDFAVETVKKTLKNVKAVPGDISAEKPFNEKFDLITAFDVLEHTLNLRSALQNINSMLKDDGLLVVAVPIASRIHHLFAALGKSFLTTMDSHLTLTTAKAWREIILPEQFEVVEEFPTTWGETRIPFVDLFHVFLLKKK
ncbi:MAG: class I SAM-dependent methyltransferase [archaeon]|jgi:2-polyprenyl-3-methyl-5-hydroxy-6-metoxy-1,4-benzoquinol methylase|nr:class I SAM-dependent methyltransferase [archaeon]